MPRSTDVDDLSLKELTDLLAKIEDTITIRRKSGLTDTKAKLAAIAAEAGFALDDLFGKSDAKRPRSAIPIKFRNPDNPAETWTGRGRQPRWLAAKLTKRGVSRDDFRV